MKQLHLAGLCLAATFLAPAAFADEADCYDAVVYARIVHQVPTDVYNCGPDCVTMDWPWFLDLDVKRVVKGKAPTGVIRNVLAIQHTWRMMNRDSEFLLRRNDAGTFNVVYQETQAPVMRCPPGTDPARAYYRRKDGTPLETLRREAEQKAGNMAR